MIFTAFWKPGQSAWLNKNLYLTLVGTQFIVSCKGVALVKEAILTIYVGCFCFLSEKVLAVPKKIYDCIERDLNIYLYN